MSELQPPKPGLDPSFEPILSEECASPFSKPGFREKLRASNEHLIATMPDFDLASQMAACVACIEELHNASGGTDENHLKTRLLCITDQFVWNGTVNDIERFLSDNRVAGSKLGTDEDLKSTLAVRFTNSTIAAGGKIDGEKVAYVQNTITGSITSDAIRNSLGRSLRHISKAEEEKAAAVERREAELWRQREGAASAAAAALERERNHEESLQHIRAVQAEILQDANRNFPVALGSVEKSEEPKSGALSVGLQKVKVACALLEAARGAQQVSPEHIETARNILFDALNQVKGTPKTDIRSEANKSDIALFHFKDYLAEILPTKEAFSEFVMNHPALIEDNPFYAQWKTQYIQKRLRERGDGQENRKIAEELVAAGIEWVKLDTNGSVGVDYETLDAMENDLREYFVYGVGDMTADKALRTATVLDGSVRAASIISQFSRSDEQILQDDIMEPLRVFLLDEVQNMQPGGPVVNFVSKEAEGWHTPYKYEATNFAGHAVTVAVRKDAEGKLRFRLHMRGGGYDTEAFSGERTMKFAAFCDRTLAVDSMEKLTIDPIINKEYGYECDDLDLHPEKLQELLDIIEQEKIEPIRNTYEPLWGSKKYTQVESRWRLPPKGLHRYGTMLAVIERSFGCRPQRVLPSFGLSAEEKQILEANTEPYTEFTRTENFGDDLPPDMVRRYYTAYQRGKQTFELTFVSPSDYLRLLNVAMHMRYRQQSMYGM